MLYNIDIEPILCMKFTIPLLAGYNMWTVSNISPPFLCCIALAHDRAGNGRQQENNLCNIWSLTQRLAFAP